MEVPGFFKVFLPSTSSERLLIPTAFVEHIKGTKTIPGRTFLRSSNGRLWSVKVIKVGNEMFFSSGWAKFVEENSLKLGDFLTFDYDGGGVFNFKLFGATTCEKVCFEKDEEEEKEKKEEKEEEKEEEEEQNVEEECEMEGNDDTDDWKNNDSDEDEKSGGDEIEVIKKTREKDINCKYGDCKGKVAVNVEGGSKISDKGEDDEDEDIFKYGIISPPTNPYFVAKFQAKNRKELYVPGDVIKNHNLKFPTKLFLHDEEGRKWQSNVVRWKDGRTWLSIGWRHFSKRNHLMSNDRCICEFIREKGQHVSFLKLRIIRVGSWLPKSS